jgi:hypothetical protein
LLKSAVSRFVSAPAMARPNGVSVGICLRGVTMAS